MKLLLTSAGWEKEPKIGKAFLRLVGKKSKDITIFFVVTPTKFLRRNRYIKTFFKRLDLVRIPEENVTIFQLDRKVTKKDLQGMDVVFVFGGNTFEYLDRIRITGLGKLLPDFLKHGGVYLGLSAGSYVACPTIEAAGWKHADRNRIHLKNLKGLHLVPFIMTAHYEKKYQAIHKKESQKTTYPVIALNDRQAILIDGLKMRFIGQGKPVLFPKDSSKRKGLG